MRIIAVCNQKGGVGKTTTTINIGAGLNQLGKKILLIDLDPQAQLTLSMGLESEENDKTIAEILRGDIKPAEATINQKGIDIIPSKKKLVDIELGLSGIPTGGQFELKKKLSRLEGYDFILIDCPPSLSILTVNALVYAREVFIPLQTEYLALKGLSELCNTIDDIKGFMNKEIVITGIIPTRFNNRVLNREVLDKIKEYFPDRVFKTIIRENISLAEAPANKNNIFEYSLHSHGAEDYLNLCNEILLKGGN